MKFSRQSRAQSQWKAEEMFVLIVVKELKGQKEVNVPLGKTSDILNWKRNVNVAHFILRVKIFRSFNFLPLHVLESKLQITNKEKDSNWKFKNIFK